MLGLRIVALGVGDYCSERFYSSSLAALADDGAWLLIDCPHPIRKILREARIASGAELRLERLVGVALTHLHADHASGLEGLGYYALATGLHGGKMPLLAGSEVAAAFATHPEAKLYDVRPVAPGAGASLGPFTIRTRRVNHGSKPAYAFQVASGDRVFAHSGDTAFDPALLDWLLEADFATHELGSGERVLDNHTGYGQLLDWSQGQPTVRVDKLHLIHYPDEFAEKPCHFQRMVQGGLYTP